MDSSVLKGFAALRVNGKVSSAKIPLASQPSMPQHALSFRPVEAILRFFVVAVLLPASPEGVVSDITLKPCRAGPKSGQKWQVRAYKQ